MTPRVSKWQANITYKFKMILFIGGIIGCWGYLFLNHLDRVVESPNSTTNFSNPVPAPNYLHTNKCIPSLYWIISFLTSYVLTGKPSAWNNISLLTRSDIHIYGNSGGTTFPGPFCLSTVHLILFVCFFRYFVYFFYFIDLFFYWREGVFALNPRSSS